MIRTMLYKKPSPSTKKVTRSPSRRIPQAVMVRTRSSTEEPAEQKAEKSWVPTKS